MPAPGWSTLRRTPLDPATSSDSAQSQALIDGADGKPRTRRQPFFELSYREARGHAIVAAIVLWVGVAVMLVAGSSRQSVIGPLKGGDFVHFYTLGRLALAGQGDQLYDASAQHALQTSLVPESASMQFLVPAYPPQVALLFAPLALAPYGVALALWLGVIVCVYVGVLELVRRHAFVDFRDRVFLAAAVLGFPPFVQLLLHGQTTVIPLLSFALGWLALEHGRPYVAGMAFGLLAAKPNLGLLLAAVALACREWRVILGGVVSTGIQLAIVVMVLGGTPLSLYARTLVSLPTTRHLIEQKPYQWHSLVAITDLLPDSLSTPVWAVGFVIVLALTVRAWKSGLPIAARMAVVVFGTVLVSPHLSIYDATLAILPIAWIGAWVERHESSARRRYWTIVYGLFVAYLFPIAAVITIQPSVFLVAWLFAFASTLAIVHTETRHSSSPVVNATG